MSNSFAGVLALLATCAAMPADSTELDRLHQIRAAMAENLERQRDCTCVQTIVRRQRRPRSGKFEPLDTLRLEVAFIGGEEVFSWPAAAQFATENVRDIVPAGSISMGCFALHANNVFLSEGAVYQYAGEDMANGTPRLRYDYAVPRESSDNLVKARGRESLVAVRGSFWVDANSLDLITLEVNADGIPPELGITSIQAVMEYARVKMGDGDFLLPARARVVAVERSSAAIRNEIEYSGCRRFAGQSVISFAEPPRLEPEPAPAPPTVVQLPSNLALKLRLLTEIAEEHSQVGDKITAVVDSPVRWRNKVVVPKGAIASGRICRFENMPGQPGLRRVALRFDTLEFGHSRATLLAGLEEFRTRFRPGHIVRVARRETTRPGMGGFRVEVKAGRLLIPRGAVFIWRTIDAESSN